MSQGEQPANFDVKTVRSRLYEHLEYVLTVSREKFSKEKAANPERRAWGRLIVQCVEAYGRLMQDAELDELGDRLSALEEASKREQGKS